VFHDCQSAYFTVSCSPFHGCELFLVALIRAMPCDAGDAMLVWLVWLAMLVWLVWLAMLLWLAVLAWLVLGGIPMCCWRG
jgi:hypothetical protein